MTTDEYRTRIIQATLKVIAETGPAAAKLADIAEQAGISYGTLYRLFPNRNELLLAAMLQQTAVMQHDWEQAAAEPDPLQRLIQIALAPVRRVEENPTVGRDLFFAIQGAPQAIEGAERETARLMELALRLIRDAVRDAHAQGYFHDLDEDVTAATILALSYTYVTGVTPPPQDWSALSAEMTKVIRRLAGRRRPAG